MDIWNKLAEDVAEVDTIAKFKSIRIGTRVETVQMDLGQMRLAHVGNWLARAIRAEGACGIAI